MLKQATNYLDSLYAKYCVGVNDLRHLTRIKERSSSQKLNLFTALGGTYAANMGMRIPLRSPPGYVNNLLVSKLYVVKAALPRGTDNQFTALLDSIITLIRGPDGRLMYDMENNRDYSGAKISKIMLNKIKKSDATDPFWADIKWDMLRSMLPRLPGENITPEVFVQNLFQYVSGLRANAVLSFEFDDFANAGEATGAFYSCYRIGSLHERSPYTLALSPSVLMLQVTSESGSLVARSWLHVDANAKIVAAFGCYGEIGEYLNEAMAFIHDKLGWKDMQSVSGYVKIVIDEEGDGKRLPFLFDAHGNPLPSDEVPVADVDGPAFEAGEMELDHIVKLSWRGSTMPKVVTVPVEHFPCPVCGKYGPETERQIICGECSPLGVHDFIGEGSNLLSGEFRECEYSIAA